VRRETRLRFAELNKALTQVGKELENSFFPKIKRGEKKTKKMKRKKQKKNLSISYKAR
jgi:hypothetical protein